MGIIQFPDNVFYHLVVNNEVRSDVIFFEVKKTGIVFFVSYMEEFKKVFVQITFLNGVFKVAILFNAPVFAYTKEYDTVNNFLYCIVYFFLAKRFVSKGNGGSEVCSPLFYFFKKFIVNCCCSSFFGFALHKFVKAAFEDSFFREGFPDEIKFFQVIFVCQVLNTGNRGSVVLLRFFGAVINREFFKVGNNGN
ncbi:hypothetical protein ES705_43668 [subsurface metagenome]